MKTIRVAFTFDEQSHETLMDMTERGNYSSPADCVRESLQVNRTFQWQAKSGFTEVILRNPDTGAEKTLRIPTLERVFKPWRWRQSVTHQFLQKSLTVLQRLRV